MGENVFDEVGLVYMFHVHCLYLLVWERTISFEIPDSVDLADNDITMIVSSTLYEKGKLSLGQAAELAGFSKRAFAEILGK